MSSDEAADETERTDPDRVGAAHGRGDDAVLSDERTPGVRRDEVDVVDIPYHPSWSTFVLLLHGPVLWAGYFLFVYLAVEWACGPGVSPDAGVAVTLWSTVLVALAIAVGTGVTATRWQEGREASHRFADDETLTTHVDPAIRDHPILGIGLMLGTLSLVGVIAVGVTALMVPPC